MDVRKIKCQGKKIFIRVDYNVPLSDSGKILDDTRIVRGLSTVKWCSDHGGKIIIATHLGYPGGKVNNNLSTSLILEIIEKHLNQKVLFVNDCIGKSVNKAVGTMKNGQILLLENLRFYEEECNNDADFARDLILGFDIYINDAFSVSHRKHASICAIQKFINNRYLGLNLTTEVFRLKNIISTTKSAVAILGGGWKATQKIEVVKNLAKNMDYILVGGALAQIFYCARGISFNATIKIPKDKIRLALSIIDTYDNIILPEDSLFFSNHVVACANINDIKKNMQLLDIGPKTIQKFKNIIAKSEVIFWNGPLGKYEDKKYENGTREIAKFISEMKYIESIICGGDTLAAVNLFKFSEKYSYLSTGGGATLNFLAGNEMPGIDIMKVEVN